MASPSSTIEGRIEMELPTDEELDAELAEEEAAEVDAMYSRPEDHAD